MTLYPDSPPLAAEPETAPGVPVDATPARADGREHRRAADQLRAVRASDLEPYTGLGYLSKLFRLIAILLLVLLVAEVGVGVYSEGVESLRTLITEASRLIVIAGVLWGAGDLATLLIDIGHDVRATRILLGRQALHPADSLLSGEPGVRTADGETPAPRPAGARRPE
ncbi:MAG: hypothetical protein ACXW61_13910 [Gemmatirosa sp.]